MYDIIYVKSGKEELARLASNCIKRQIPVTYYGGITVRLEVVPGWKPTVKRWLTSLKSFSEKNGHVFELETYVESNGEYVYTENYFEK